MNKQQFFGKLNTFLKKLPSEEQNDIIEDFEEHFSLGAEEGKTESEIAASLGAPEQIGKELLATYRVEKVEKEASAGNLLRAIWAVMGLGFFNLVFILGPFTALAALVLAGWIIAASFSLLPLIVLVNVAIFPESFELFDLFLSFMMSGLGLFISLGMLYVTRACIICFIRYIKFNAKIVKGGAKDE